MVFSNIFDDLDTFTRVINNYQTVISIGNTNFKEYIDNYIDKMIIDPSIETKLSDIIKNFTQMIKASTPENNPHIRVLGNYGVGKSLYLMLFYFIFKLSEMPPSLQQKLISKINFIDQSTKSILQSKEFNPFIFRIQLQKNSTKT